MNRMSRLNRRSGTALLLFICIVLLGIYVAAAHRPFGIDMGEIALMDWIKMLGPWGGLGVIALMIIHSFIPFPAEIVAFMSGEIFGLLWGTIYAWIGAMIGASLAFAIARVFGQKAVASLLPQASAARLAEWSVTKSANALLIARFIPLIAFNLINYAAGLTRVRWWTFLWTTGLGILPLTIFFVYLGYRMRAATWWEWLIMALAALLLWGTAHLVAWLARR